MGDWRTLHFFDKEKYKNEIVPMIKDIAHYLPRFLNESRLRKLHKAEESRNELISDLITFISELNDDLMIHSKLKAIGERKPDETYNYFIRRRNDEFDMFHQSNLSIIESYEFLLIETIFSTVADFNPYFILGKRIFESCITAKEDSLAEDFLGSIRSTEPGSITDLVNGGIINFLSKEDVQLFIYDLDNLQAVDDESVHYVNEFKAFTKYAHQNNLGLITLRNPNEIDLYKLKKIPIHHEEFVKSNNFDRIVIEEY